MDKFKGVAIGAGYFSIFQYEAWNRIPEVEMAAFCNSNKERAQKIIDEYGVPNHYTDYKEMIEKEQPQFVDIITPPESHFEMTKFAIDRGIHVICQKPLAPTYEECLKIVDYTRNKKARFMVHENWRFQPWYREIKLLIESDAIGQVHTVNFRKRMGDGWGENAYIPRQPYFRKYPRLIVYENGIHFIDTFRYLFGDIKRVYAQLRKLNPVIAGEDWAIINFEFENNETIGLWDANRYNEPNYDNPRYTFGTFLIEGLKGSIRLYHDGKITIQKLGGEEIEHIYNPSKVNFSGDCVYFTQKHFIDKLSSGEEFETHGGDYIKSIKIQEAIYHSAKIKQPVVIAEFDPLRDS